MSGDFDEDGSPEPLTPRKMGRTGESDYLAASWETKGKGTRQLPLGTAPKLPALQARTATGAKRVKQERMGLASYINSLGLGAYMKNCRKGETEA